MFIMDMLVAELVPKRPPPTAFLRADLLLPDGTVIPHSRHEKYEDEGQGTFSDADGAVFEGQWVDERIHGDGTALFASGNCYEGTDFHVEHTKKRGQQLANKVSSE
ncbi:unnamed protein product [Vitrella brassicaformis CCMP3155]|uniref:MORN repeat-containing protein 5 n=1 Tax=Vitrella brassicaformis (strain CCMP3155) TaxID=1169540 RepID=A0A0G4GD17_VITBC|nr:unnamed protein product [Vitrella brassicaformis CCMP3155]|eukprot:CEM27150.1 unnamed protein product [Vitrella brassicaformis CCMP3155]